MRRRKPDPLAADVVHVGEDGSDGADVAGRLRLPDGGVKIFDEHLVHAIAGSEDPGCGGAELSAGVSDYAEVRKLRVGVWPSNRKRAVRVVGRYGHGGVRLQ